MKSSAEASPTKRDEVEPADYPFEPASGLDIVAYIGADQSHGLAFRTRNCTRPSSSN